MKKMQCEVCGSNEIKKVADDIFECQSCGVQYSKDDVKKLLVEITGSVKMDYSDEVKNAITRAEQFDEEGDIDKAEEYYNKALDMDAENPQAKEKIKKIKKEKSIPQNVFILKKDKGEKQAILTFLKELKTSKNIAPDIYKEVEIISITEQYFPFLVIGGTYQGSYSGTALHRKEVQYTDYEQYTDYVNGKPVKRTRPVTKTRIEYDKELCSGTYSADCREIYSISSTLNSLLTKYQAGKFDDFVESKWGTLEASNSYLIKSLESNINTLYDAFYDKTIQLNADNLPTDMTIDVIPAGKKSWAKRADAQYTESVNSACKTQARICVGGDKSENISFDWNATSECINYIYIPVQVIEYSYKGDFYFVTNILSKQCSDLSFVYPYYKKVDAVTNEGNKNIYNMRPKGGYGAWAWGIALFALFIGWLFGRDTYLLRDILYGLAYVNFGLGAFLTLLGLINLVRANRIKNNYIKKISSLSTRNKEELNKGYKIFFDNYAGIDSIPTCNDAVEKSCVFSCPLSEIIYGINATNSEGCICTLDELDEEPDDEDYDEEYDEED